VDLDPEEEALDLASLDPIAAMAGAEKEALAGLLDALSVEDERSGRCSTTSLGSTTSTGSATAW
jgi:hypothetical protein